MVMNSAAGAGAYSAVANIAGKAIGETGTDKSSKGGMEFSELINSVLSNISESGAASEAQGANIANGNADVLDLVTAVAETELAVETLVVVRDRVISAYQEILNMPI